MQKMFVVIRCSVTQWFISSLKMELIFTGREAEFSNTSTDYRELLPAGVNPQLGPDATGLGWVYQYTLNSDKRDLQELRSIQDFFLKYELSSIQGVAEVASIGGYVKQYQVNLDPNKLASYNIPLQKVKMAIKQSNNDVGGRLLEIGEMEFMVRSLGYIQSKEDLENVAIGVSPNSGSPIYLKDVATYRYWT